MEGTLVSDHATTSSLEVAYSPNGNLLASCGDSNIKIWKSETMELLHTYDTTSDVRSISWSPTGPFILSGDSDNSVRLSKVAILEEFYNDREKRMIILGAFTRFEKAVHKAKGSEKEKVNAVVATYPKTPIDVETLLAAISRGRGSKGGVLWELLKWMVRATKKVWKKKGKTKGSITKV